MKRRDFIKVTSGFTAIGALGASNSVSALLNCSAFNLQGIQQCEAGIDSGLAHISAAATGNQYMDQWCWAACIEMVFRYHNFRVPQPEIVRQTWGSIVNFPAQPSQILSNLNRAWVDSQGRSFLVAGNTYSANQVTAAQDLSRNMPLIIGTMGHAMVLTSLVYVTDQYGNGDVLSAVVRDPWPGRGRRILNPQEWYSASFLARIRVS